MSFINSGLSIVILSGIWFGLLMFLFKITFPKNNDYHKASIYHNILRGFVHIFFVVPNGIISSIIISFVLGLLYILYYIKILSSKTSLTLRIRLSALWVLSFLYILEFWCNTHYVISYENDKYLGSFFLYTIESVHN